MKGEMLTVKQRRMVQQCSERTGAAVSISYVFLTLLSPTHHPFVPLHRCRSSNEKLRRIQLVSGPTQIDAAAQLKTMKGIEYTIDTRIPPNPHFNIIYKQNRTAENRCAK